MSKLVFQLSLRHDYYQSGRPPHLGLIPDASTADALRASRCLLLANCTDTKILNTSKQETKSVLDYLAYSGVISLRFEIVSENTNFYSITEIPSNSLGRVYARTRRENTGSSQNLCFTLRDQLLLHANSIGVVEIFLSDLQAAYEPQPSHCNPATSYTLRFPVRKTSWRYCLFNRGQQALHSPTVGNQHGLSFEDPKSIVVNGEQGLQFDSGNRQFPLAERPQETFSLVDHVTTQSQKSPERIRNRTLISKLPIPAPQDVKFHIQGNKEFGYSQMYVYL